MPTNRVEKRFSARTITGDIPRFWAAFEHLDDPEAKEAFENLYLSVGTPGLRDFTSLRIGTATALVEHVRSSRAYYTSIRAETLALSNDAEIFLPSARALVELYPEAMLPDVTFLIGRMSSGGTTSDAGILIGTELFTRAPHTPAHELDAWEQAVTRPATVLPYVVAHELIHVQQPQAVSLVLLAHCLREGSAEVLGEVISGGGDQP